MARPLYLIGNFESRRTRFFVEAVRRTDLKWRLISWERILSADGDWAEGIEEGSSIRIDSPGQNFTVEKALLARGEEPSPAFSQFSYEQLRDLSFEKGRILALNQWYLGWKLTLQKVEERLRDLKVRYFNPPSDIATMFDKPLCHSAVEKTGTTVPPIMGMPKNFDEVMELMNTASCRRVFLKPRYSSSASGIVALEIRRGDQQAFSSIEMVKEEGVLKLFNSRRVKRYQDLNEVRTLINAICRENVYLERWLPKAGLAGKRFDLRVLVVGGVARQMVVRSSKHPMTNLHLGAQRGDLELLKKTMGDAAWNAAMAAAEKAMTAFPHSLYGGVDLLISPGWEKHHVLEVNAFGDLLVNVLWQGMDAYALELKTWVESDRGE